MKRHFILPLASILCMTSLAHADTLAVLPGESIQAKIDLANAGDIVAIFGGIYNENLTVDEAIRLVEVSGQEVTITGSITFTGITDAPPFEGFTVGSSGMNIVVNNTTGLVLRNVDHTAGNTVQVTGTTTSLQITECQLHNLSADAGITEISNSSLTGGIGQGGGILNTTNITVAGDFSTAAASSRTIAYRTTVRECFWKSNRSWFGYGKAVSFIFEGSNAKVVVVGSEIDRLGNPYVGMLLTGNDNVYLVCNSVIKGTISSSHSTDNNIYISGSGHTAVFANNYLHKTHSSNAYSFDNIFAGDQVTNLLIQNNICSNTVDGMVRAPFGATVRNNHAVNPSYSGVSGGVLAENTTSGDPLLVDGNPYELGEGSPCIDAGTPDARYNDRDGSPNDIGPSGGGWFDPDGWTTENPVVISFDLQPDQVLEGFDTEVILSEGVGVSAP